MLPPLIVAVLAVVLASQWPEIADLLQLQPGAMLARWSRLALDTFAVIAAAWLAIRLLDRLVWRGLVQRRSGAPVPRLVVDLVAVLVWVAALGVIAAWVFEAEVTGLVATSGVTIAVIGFALRDIMASLFAGMALSLERPGGIGDWIEVESGTVAKVEQVGWLTTRAVSRDGVGLVIPNARLATTVWRNYSGPGPAWRDSVRVPLDDRVPPETAERLLLAALHEVPAVHEHAQRPDVKIAEFSDRGTIWLARYWLSDYADLQDVRYQVQRAILRHLHYAGIDLARPRLDNYLHRSRPAGREHREHLRQLLAEHELFAGIEEIYRARLVERAIRHVCHEGEPVVRAGEPGSSMFVLIEGLLQVRVPGPDGRVLFGDDLHPGSVFGEFSLLTGEPRSATITPFVDSVVYEIRKDDIQPILAECHGLAHELSRILADRQGRSRELATRRAAARAPMRPAQGVVLDRLRAFFGLPEGD
jgi:small-conductance mechanosensitive channel/CRP-like cAMP-binding protein